MDEAVKKRDQKWLPELVQSRCRFRSITPIVIRLTKLI